MDAFISYRRDTGKHYASELYTFLTEEGKMDVFYDINGLYRYAGAFPSVLKENILSADNFILILTDLNISNYETSVYVQEIVTAIEANKRIIVLMGNGFQYPETLPPQLEKLPKLQTLDINDWQYFKDRFRIDLVAKMFENEKQQTLWNKLCAFTKLESRGEIESRMSLEARLGDDVVGVDMCAFACQGFLSHARENVHKLLTKGGKIRVLMNDPASAAAQDAYKNKIAGGNLKQRSRIISQTYDDLLDWREEFPSQFAGKTTDAFLTCAIFIIHKQDPKKSTIKVDYYSFGCPDSQRRCVMISAGDEDNFNFYLNQFEYLWEQGKPITEGEQNV